MTFTFGFVCIMLLLLVPAAVLAPFAAFALWPEKTLVRLMGEQPMEALACLAKEQSGVFDIEHERRETARLPDCRERRSMKRMLVELDRREREIRALRREAILQEESIVLPLR